SFSSSRLFEEILKYFYFSFLRKAHQLCLPAQLTSRLPTSRVVERRRIMASLSGLGNTFLRSFFGQTTKPCKNNMTSVSLRMQFAPRTFAREKSRAAFRQ
ncbi:MAG: hypothetical protein KGL40_10155, partial [Rhodocyclaceae bacterium]|nr:hypothetical protein [Rhodocyclaceae bacterium]